MSSNSVAINAIFIFTISCSLFDLSISGLIDNTIIPDNTSLSPIQTINNTITDMAATITEKLAQIQTFNSSRVMEQIKQNSELMEDYKDALAENINLLQLVLHMNTSLTSVKSNMLELEKNIYNNVTRQNNILVFELSLETLRLTAKLYQDQENKSNFTEAYDKLNDKYMKWKNSLNDSRLNNEELNNILLQLYDTLKKLSFAQNQIIDDSTEINKKYNKNSESLIICENNVQILNNKIVELEKVSGDSVYLKARNIILEDNNNELKNALANMLAELRLSEDSVDLKARNIILRYENNELKNALANMSDLNKSKEKDSKNCNVSFTNHIETSQSGVNHTFSSSSNH